MKKSILSVAVAAGMTGLAATATAQMHLNDKGLGEALIYPFYSAENGNDTYVHVVNTTGVGKAVKIRIIEARNSQEVLDFNLYMSPEDHFSFAITESDDGEGAKLVTGDNSCTAPAIPAGGQPFVNFKYDDDDNDSLGRTKTGYIEVIEMGQIEPGSALDDAVTHSSSGVPADCDYVIEQWSTGGAWLSDTTTGFDPVWDDTATPAGGLYGISYVVNPEEAYAVGVDAVAIDDMVNVTDANALAVTNNGGALHFEPGDEEPNFASVGVDDESVIFVDGGTQAFDFAGANGVGSESLDQVDAVSSLFMTTELANDFILDDGRLAATDWVITSPTKLFYVNGVSTAREPFSEVWDETDESCEPFALSLWDREEANVTITTGPIFSPAPPTSTPDDFVACTEQFVLQMGERPAIGATAGSTAIDLSDNIEYSEGWARISFDPADLNDAPTGLTRTLTDGTVTATGLPVTGFAATKLYNSAAKEGVEAYYMTANAHKGLVVTSSN